MKEYVTIKTVDTVRVDVQAELNCYAGQGYVFKGTTPSWDGIQVIMERERICLCHEPGELEEKPEELEMPNETSLLEEEARKETGRRLLRAAVPTSRSGRTPVFQTEGEF